MVLKRKRSASELCSSPSASSTCSSAFSFSSPPTTSNSQMPIFWDSSNSTVSRNLFAAPAHLNSRTMKRFRGSRPSEEMVHQRTLSLLFSAQQQQQQHQRCEASNLPPAESQPVASSTSTDSTQHSLHRFWNISSAPRQPTTNIHVSQQRLSSGCEDCGASLDASSLMEMDCSEPGSNACGSCGKQVCFSCSVSNLGEEKRCLQCAGRINAGWTNETMQIA